MTAHELARKLLEGPDHKVCVRNGDGVFEPVAELWPSTVDIDELVDPTLPVGRARWVRKEYEAIKLYE